MVAKEFLCQINALVKLRFHCCFGEKIMDESGTGVYNNLCKKLREDIVGL